MTVDYFKMKIQYLIFSVLNILVIISILKNSAEAAHGGEATANQAGGWVEPGTNPGSSASNGQSASDPPTGQQDTFNNPPQLSSWPNSPRGAESNVGGTFGGTQGMSLQSGMLNSQPQGPPPPGPGPYGGVQPHLEPFQEANNRQNPRNFYPQQQSDRFGQQQTNYPQSSMEPFGQNRYDQQPRDSRFGNIPQNGPQGGMNGMYNPPGARQSEPPRHSPPPGNDNFSAMRFLQSERNEPQNQKDHQSSYSYLNPQGRSPMSPPNQNSHSRSMYGQPQDPHANHPSNPNFPKPYGEPNPMASGKFAYLGQEASKQNSNSQHFDQHRGPPQQSRSKSPFHDILNSLNGRNKIENNPQNVLERSQSSGRWDQSLPKSEAHTHPIHKQKVSGGDNQWGVFQNMQKPPDHNGPNHHGPPNHHNQPDPHKPPNHYSPPNNHHGPPNNHHGPPNNHHGPPNNHLGPPNSHRGPPNNHQNSPNPHPSPPSILGSLRPDALLGENNQPSWPEPSSTSLWGDQPQESPHRPPHGGPNEGPSPGHRDPHSPPPYPPNDHHPPPGHRPHSSPHGDPHGQFGGQRPPPESNAPKFDAWGRRIEEKKPEDPRAGGAHDTSMYAGEIVKHKWDPDSMKRRNMNRPREAAFEGPPPHGHPPRDGHHRYPEPPGAHRPERPGYDPRDPYYRDRYPPPPDRHTDPYADRRPPHERGHPGSRYDPPPRHDPHGYPDRGREPPPPGRPPYDHKGAYPYPPDPHREADPYATRRPPHDPYDPYGTRPPPPPPTRDPYGRYPERPPDSHHRDPYYRYPGYPPYPPPYPPYDRRYPGYEPRTTTEPPALDATLDLTDYSYQPTTRNARAFFPDNVMRSESMQTKIIKTPVRPKPRPRPRPKPKHERQVNENTIEKKPVSKPNVWSDKSAPTGVSFADMDWNSLPSYETTTEAPVNIKDFSLTPNVDLIAPPSPYNAYETVARENSQVQGPSKAGLFGIYDHSNSHSALSSPQQNNQQEIASTNNQPHYSSEFTLKQKQVSLANDKLSRDKQRSQNNQETLQPLHHSINPTKMPYPGFNDHVDDDRLHRRFQATTPSSRTSLFSRAPLLSQRDKFSSHSPEGSNSNFPGSHSKQIVNDPIISPKYAEHSLVLTDPNPSPASLLSSASSSSSAFSEYSFHSNQHHGKSNRGKAHELQPLTVKSSGYVIHGPLLDSSLTGGAAMKEIPSMYAESFNPKTATDHMGNVVQKDDTKYPEPALAKYDVKHPDGTTSQEEYSRVTPEVQRLVSYEFNTTDNMYKISHYMVIDRYSMTFALRLGKDMCYVGLLNSEVITSFKEFVNKTIEAKQPLIYSNLRMFYFEEVEQLFKNDVNTTAGEFIAGSCGDAFIFRVRRITQPAIYTNGTMIPGSACPFGKPLESTKSTEVTRCPAGYCPSVSYKCNLQYSICCPEMPSTVNCVSLSLGQMCVLYSPTTVIQN